MENQIKLNKETKIQFYIYIGMRILVSISIVFFLLDKDWSGALGAIFILGLMLLPSLLKNKYDLYLPTQLEFAIVVFVFLSLFLGSLQDWYEKFFFWDVILHLKSGFLLAVIGFLVIYTLNKGVSEQIHMSPGFIALFSVCFSLALSVVWEIYEYTVDSLFGFNMQRTGLPDTMKDLIFNTIGSITVAVSAFFAMRRTKNIPFIDKDIK